MLCKVDNIVNECYLTTAGFIGCFLPVSEEDIYMATINCLFISDKIYIY